MNVSKRQKCFQVGLVLAISMLLGLSLPASSFSQDSSDGTVGGDKASGINMQAVSGTVVETMNSGGYTYALVKKDSAKTWVALPKSRIAVGNEITCQPGTVMNNFGSSSLNRTFKQIVFSSGITSLSGDVPPPKATSAPNEAPPAPKIKEPENWKDF